MNIQALMQKTIPFIVFLLIMNHFGFSQTETLSTTKDSLIIKGDRIWIREYPRLGKVLFTLNDGSVCQILQKGEKQIIKGVQDFWYKIEYKNKVGWVFGSQSSLRQKASLDNFEPFLKYFIKTCLLENNLDSLLLYKSPVITQFQNKQIGFYRLFNPGASCTIEPIDEWYYKNTKDYYSLFQNMTELKFNNILPKKGFCEESNETDGVYYKHVDALPNYFDFNTNNLGELPLPPSYKSKETIKVVILNQRKFGQVFISSWLMANGGLL